MSHTVFLAALVLVLVALGLSALGVAVPLADVLEFLSDSSKEGAVVFVVALGIWAIVTLGRKP